jgi:peptidyl-prolyl cis-trans isomerase SurA
MRISRKGCALVLWISFLWAGAAFGETLDRIVAVVNGDIILYSDLQAKIRVIEKTSPGAKPGDPSLQPQFEREVLNQMIRDRLTEQEVRRMKISVSQQEVDNALESMKKENNFTDAQFEYVVGQSGQTVEQFREGIKREMERSRLLERVLKSKTIVTDAQVDAYLKTARTQESDAPDRLRLAVIFLPIAEGSQGKTGEGAEKLAQDLHDRIKKGEDFAKLAREYSKGPAVADGGDIGYIATEELAPYIAAAVRDLKPNDVSEVVRASTGFYIVKVIDTRREKLDATGAGAREKARRILFQQEMSRKFENWVKELEARSFIQVSL